MFFRSNKPNIGYIIKTAACIAVFFASMAFFSLMCKALVDNYIFLIAPTMKITVPWLIKLGISVLLILITLGIVAVLVRPVWLAIATLAAGSILYPLIAGGGYITWILAAVSCASLSGGYLYFVVKQMRNQVNFSTHPLGEKKLLVCSLLALLIAVSLGLGYAEDSARRNYIIVPEIKTLAQDYVVYQAIQIAVKQYPKITAKQKEAAAESVKKNMKKTFDDVEKNMEKYKSTLPVIFGAIAFMIFQMVLIFIAMIASIFSTFIFSLLRITHFTRITTETCEVKHLTLKTVPIERKGK
ncbi:hypothetical protein HZA39_01345 [Candidatus Peregrinibacteria bacterium]|nr:hypothetical protein [Candidatus Peregrinibacteria bacterium]